MKKWKIIRLILSIFFVIVFIFSAWQIVAYKLAERDASKLYNKIITEAVIDTPDDSNTPIKVDFEKLKKENEDIVGWIYSADTPINYPVLKGSNNDEYIHTMLNGEANKAGSIFADYRLNGNVDESINYIIYGHNMKNNTMFGTLTDYKKQAYYDAHKEMYLLTPEKNYVLKVYAGYVTKADDKITYKFDYTYSELDRYMDTVRDKSNFKTDIVYEHGKPIVTLSTCAYNFEDARYIIVCIAEELT